MMNLERTIYIGPCAFSGNFSTTGNGRYIELPVKNISELNTHMCEPMNRKGRLCSECIKDFGPSVISFGLVCSNCTGAWYGIPLYLFLEFVPITVFYLIILLFRVNSEHNFSSNGHFCIFQPSLSHNIPIPWC